MVWVLYVWLAFDPNRLTVIDEFASAQACFSRRKAEVDDNIRIGIGAGRTYVCLKKESDDVSS